MYKPSVRGYGYRYLPGRGTHRRRYAHREALEGKIGRVLGAGEMSCHQCDNPPCVNPEHLWVGTNRQNVDDCIAKGRSTRGSMNGLAKMNEADVVEVRVMRAAGVTYREISAKFGVTISAISHIFNKGAWKHV